VSSCVGHAPNVLHTRVSTALVLRMLAWWGSFHESSPPVPLDLITQLLLQLNFTSCLDELRKEFTAQETGLRLCSPHGYEADCWNTAATSTGNCWTDGSGLNCGVIPHSSSPNTCLNKTL